MQVDNFNPCLEFQARRRHEAVLSHAIMPANCCNAATIFIAINITNRPACSLINQHKGTSHV